MSTPPVIYNLFPLLAGPFDGWTPHLERASAMGFNHIYFNPVSYPGFSGSLYSVKHHYGFHPELAPDGDEKGQISFAAALSRMGELNLIPMMDLVIGHTAIDCPLVETHPDWFERDEAGKVVNPGADHNGEWVSWGDLAKIDNRHSPDRDALWSYWDALVAHHQALGVRAFRCDAAYQIPIPLWEYLIDRARGRDGQVKFFAETLGCPFEQVVELARAGFDYTFNSAKWWDFAEPWCLEQYEATRTLVGTVAFPESHDTPRLAEEVDGDAGRMLTRYAFSALFSTGVMMPMGFETGTRKKLDVVTTRPGDWERRLDLADAVGEINRLKLAHPLFCGEGPVRQVAANADHVIALEKNAPGALAALLLISRPGTGTVPEHRPDGWESATDITPECLAGYGFPMRVLQQADGPS